MGTISVETSGRRLSEPSRLLNIKQNLQVVKDNYDGKPWYEMTTVQKLFYILTLGLWRPEFNNAKEKLEIYNLVTGLLTQLQNLSESSNSCEPLADLRIGDMELQCRIDRKGYTLIDHHDSIFISHDEFKKIREAQGIVPDGTIPFYEYETVETMSTAFDSINNSAIMGMPFERAEQFTVDPSFLGANSSDFYRGIANKEICIWTIQGVRIQNPEEFFINIVSQLDKNYANTHVLPDYLPTTLLPAQVTEALKSVPLSEDDRNKVFNTLITPGAFEILIAITFQGLVAPAEILNNSQNSGAFYNAVNDAEGTPLYEWKNSNNTYTFSVDVQDSQCRAVARYFLPKLIAREGVIKPCYSIPQAELRSRSENLRERVSLNKTSDNPIGVGLSGEASCAVIMFSNEQ